MAATATTPAGGATVDGAGVGASVGAAGEPTIICEGTARIEFPPGNQVFYNKVQEFNRDLSTCVIDTYGRLLAAERRVAAEAASAKIAAALAHNERPSAAASATVAAAGRGLRILEALAATGLRSIRYAREIEGVEVIVANDLKPEAVDTIRTNVVANGLDPTLVVPNCGDAVAVMASTPRERAFDVIDLDPYGSAAVFIPAAVASVANGGLLAVTCTDMAVLSGNHPEAAFAKYGVMPLHKRYLHEFALRTVLSTLDRAAALHSRHIVPLLSLSIDFYVRVFVRVFDSKREAQEGSTRLGSVYHCCGCDAFHVQPLGELSSRGGASRKIGPPTGPPVGVRCELCDSRFRVGGPIWTRAMHSPDFIAALHARLDTQKGKFKTEARIRGMSSVAAEELADVPLYYDLPSLSKLLRLTAPPVLVVRSGLLNAGYRVSAVHGSDSGLKTDAPYPVLIDVYRAWAQSHPPVSLVADSPGAKLFALAPTHEANLAPHPDANPASRRAGLVRFQANPEPEWGPKARATGKRTAVEAGIVDPTAFVVLKRKAGQGRRAAKLAASEADAESHLGAPADAAQAGAAAAVAAGDTKPAGEC